MAKNSQMSLNRNQRNENTQSIAHTPIAPFGCVMIAFLFALGAINFADKAVLGLAAVSIIKELHLSPAQYGLLSGSIFWLFSLSSVLVTGWSDRIGTKKVLALLATTWAIVQIATLFVFSFPALLLTRIVLGAGEGPSYGTSVAVATPWLPADRRTIGLAVVTLGSYVGPALFAPLLTFMIVIVGWRSAFALLGVIGIIWLIFWVLIGREPAKESSISTSEPYMARSGTNWSHIFPVLFSPTVIFSAFAGFGMYWASALYLSWNPVYLVTVRHLRLSDPLFHPRTNRRSCANFVDHYFGSGTRSTPWIYSGYCRSRIYAARYHCSTGNRIHHPAGRKERDDGISACISAGKSLTPVDWCRLPGICAP